MAKIPSQEVDDSKVIIDALRERSEARWPITFEANESTGRSAESH